MRSNPGEPSPDWGVLVCVMEKYPEAARPQTLTLAPGAQAVINGALVTASVPCTLEVGSGAYVFSGRRLWRDPMHNPHEELYFSILEVAGDDDRFLEERFRLFALLSQVVVQDRTHEAQQECAFCASALLTGKRAARLASMRVGSRNGNRRKLPGSRGEKRQSIELPNSPPQSMT